MRAVLRPGRFVGRRSGKAAPFRWQAAGKTGAFRSVAIWLQPRDGFAEWRFQSRLVAQWKESSREADHIRNHCRLCCRDCSRLVRALCPSRSGCDRHTTVLRCITSTLPNGENIAAGSGVQLYAQNGSHVRREQRLNGLCRQGFCRHCQQGLDRLAQDGSTVYAEKARRSTPVMVRT